MDPFLHHMHVAQLSQAAEEALPCFFHLLPGGIGIDGGDAVGHEAATAKRHAEIMDRIGRKGDTGTVAFFEDALHPEGKSGFIFGGHGEWIVYRVPEETPDNSPAFQTPGGAWNFSPGGPSGTLLIRVPPM